MKRLLLATFVLGLILVACKKQRPISDYIPDKVEDQVINNDSKTDTSTSTSVAKKVKFVLAAYSGTIPNFEDTAKKSLNILSEVFSSKEFKDSLLKYSFVCSNASSEACLGNSPLLHRYKCDNSLNLIKGETVYEDLVADTIKNIRIEIRPSTGSSSFGFTYVCSDKITSYDWFLKGGRSLPTPIEYAIHLAHEYTHTVGYIHNSKKHVKSEDVAYRIGGIVRNILIRKMNLSVIAGQELASLLGKPNFNYLRIRVDDLPDLSEDFKQIYDQVSASFTATEQNISYLYLQFLPDNKAKLGVRATNANKTFFVITFDLDMAIDDDGICSFVYTGGNTANSTNRERIKPILDYLSSASFEVSFMNKRAPVNGIVGGFMSVENPTSFFYGVMLNSL